jgi:death-on-curing protein
VRFADVVFLDVDDVVMIHEMGIARHGGTLGLRDPGLLASAVAAPRAGYYESLAELAAALCHGLAKNHAFLDGNKRVAFTACATFLACNGRPLGSLPTDAWEAVVVGVASGTVSRSELGEHLRVAMGGDPVVIRADD